MTSSKYANNTLYEDNELKNCEWKWIIHFPRVKKLGDIRRASWLKTKCT